MAGSGELPTAIQAYGDRYLYRNSRNRRIFVSDVKRKSVTAAKFPPVRTAYRGAHVPYQRTLRTLRTSSVT